MNRALQHRLNSLFQAVLVALVTFAFGSFSANAVEIVAHRGASADAPENTLPAFNLAWEQGADVVEGDFYMTSDHKIVCFHDKTTERVTGTNLTVTTTSYTELQTLDVGAWKDPKWKGTKIPTLAEVLATLPADKGRLFIEIKDSVRIVKPLAEQLKKAGVPKSRMAIICFNGSVIAACKKTMPEVDAHWVVSTKTYNKMGLKRVMRNLKRWGADGLDIQASAAITPELGVALRGNGLEFHCWTVNDLPLARHMIKMGVDSITTDHPVLLKESVPEQNPNESIF
jgi:glycerophosphoryl diester phosphodiesterase